MTTENRLKEIFDDVLQFGDALVPDQPRDAYDNWDSLANVTLMMAIAEEFGDIVTLDDMAKLDSFAKLLAFIQSHQE